MTNSIEFRQIDSRLAPKSPFVFNSHPVLQRRVPVVERPAVIVVCSRKQTNARRERNSLTD